MELLRNQKRFSLNLGGKLLDLSTPRILGILNATPDSFYPDSRCTDAEMIANRARQIVEEGADVIDLGAYSSRPGAEEVSPEEVEAVFAKRRAEGYRPQPKRKGLYGRYTSHALSAMEGAGY